MRLLKTLAFEQPGLGAPPLGLAQSAGFFGEQRARLDQASALLDSKLKEAQGEGRSEAEKFAFRQS